MSRHGVMLAKPYTERLLDGWHQTSFIIQPKINGLRCRALITPQSVKLFSSEALEITSIPHINEALGAVCTAYVQFDGELYVHGMPLQDIRSIVSRKVNRHLSYKQIEYHIFDMILDAEQLQRIHLRDAFMPALLKYPCIKCVPTHPFCEKKDLNKMLQYYLDQNFEGIILRHPSAKYHPCRTQFLLKLKPRNKADYTICGAFEAISIDGYPKNTLGGLVLKIDEGKIFHCGCGNLTHVERQFLWDAWKKDKSCLLGGQAFIYYQELSKAGIPQQPILRYIEGL